MTQTTTQESNECRVALTWRSKWLGLVEHTQEVRQMAEACERFSKRFVRNDRVAPLLFLGGRSGTGKTHAAKRICKFARAAAVTAWELGHWVNPPSICFVQWAEFVESESDGVERDARESDLAILDDVGSEADRFKSGAPIDKLCQLLSARAGRFTLVTSNLDLSQWADKDVRVADRLMRGSERVQLRHTQSWAVVNQEQAPTPEML